MSEKSGSIPYEMVTGVKSCSDFSLGVNALLHDKKGMKREPRPAWWKEQQETNRFINRINRKYSRSEG